MDAGEHGVYFGQLLGMADPLTYVLGRNGYRVSVQGPLLSIRYDIRAGRSASAGHLLALCLCGKSRSRFGSGCVAEASQSMHLTCCYP